MDNYFEDYSRVALKISLLYVVVGSLWIFISDQEVFKYAGDSELFLFLSSVKGFIYVLVTGFLFYLFAKRHISKLKKTEEIKKETENKFFNVFKFSPEGIVITTFPDGVVVDINDHLLNILGYSREEVFGKKTLELGVWDSVDSRTKLIEDIKEKGESINNETKFKRKNGTIGVGFYSSIKMNIENKPHLLTIFTDITDKKKIEEDLKNKMDELKKMNNLMIGRELKMVELKKKLAELNK